MGAGTAFQGGRAPRSAMRHLQKGRNKKPRTIAGPIGAVKLVFVARLIRALNATVSVERNGGLIHILVVPVRDSAGAGRTAIPVNFSVDALYILPGHARNYLSLHLSLA